MRIVSSNAALAADYSMKEDFATSVTRETAMFSGDRQVSSTVSQNAVDVNISEEGMNLSRQENGAKTQSVDYSAQGGYVEASSFRASSYLSSKEDLELSMLSRLLEGITGKRMQLRPIRLNMETDSEALDGVVRALRGGPGTALNPASFKGGAPTRTNRTTTTIESTYSREDRMSFSAAAQVQTADGMQIDISMSLSMSRSFATSQGITWTTETQFCDPLMLNFNGRGVELEGETFSFDIDNDGAEDQISRVAGGSGFLALDHNGDGAINSGGELFGTESGNGFADLAAYDADGNGWIDEGDAVFDKLRIMSVGSDGSQKLVGLGEAGVGAIYLGSSQSDFEIRDGNNEAQGKVTHTGFFLYESGKSGYAQNVNFRMYDAPAREPALYDQAIERF